MTKISIICVNGTHGFNIFWKNNKTYHRLDGPAITQPNGTKEWWKDDKLHRDAKPAVICSNGTEYWYKEGIRHRDDGPAVIYPVGIEVWYKEGEIIKGHNDRD